MLPKFFELFPCQCVFYNSRELKLMLGTCTFIYLFQVWPLRFTRAGACMYSSITRTGALYDHKSDPDTEANPTMWWTGLPIICCVRLTVLYTVLIKYKNLWRIILNVCAPLTSQQFICNPRDIRWITRHSVCQLDSNTATCKFIVSVVGRSPCCVDRLSASFNYFSTNDC